MHEFRIKIGAGYCIPVDAGSGHYLPAQKIAIAAVVTFLPAAFDAQGNYANSSEQIFRAIAAFLAPNDAPPTPLEAVLLGLETPGDGSDAGDSDCGDSLCLAGDHPFHLCLAACATFAAKRT